MKILNLAALDEDEYDYLSYSPSLRDSPTLKSRVQRPLSKPARSEDKIRRDMASLLNQQIEAQRKRWGKV